MKRIVSAAVILAAAALLASCNRKSDDAEVEPAFSSKASKVNELLKGMDNAEVTFFKIDPSASDDEKPLVGEVKKLQNWTILSEKILTDAKTVKRARVILADPKTYGGMGAFCFTPGMGFRFKDGARTVEFVICLKCNWVYGYEGKENKASWELSKAGVKRLLNFYNDQTKDDPKPEPEAGRKD